MRHGLITLLQAARIPIGLVVLLFVWRGSILDMVSIAMRSADGHYVFLIPVVAMYLIIVRHGGARVAGGVRGAVWGVPLAFAGVMLGQIGQDRDILVLWHAAPIVCGLALLLSIYGLAWMQARLAAFILLFAIIPIPGEVRQLVSIPLQGLATGITAWILDQVGVPAVRVGNLMEIRGVQVAVGEACDGMRLLVPLFVIMYAFVYSLPLRGGTRFLLMVACGPVAIVCNVLRLVPTAIAYGYFFEDAPWIHSLGGWFMIPLAIGLLLGFLRLLEWLDLPVARYRLVVS